MSSNNTKRLFREAKENFKNRDFLKSLALTNQIIKQEPDNKPALLLLAKNLKNTGNLNLAIKAYDELLKQDKQIIDAYLDLSEIYYNTKHYEMTAKILTLARKVDNNHFEVIRRLALVYKVLRLNREAAELFVIAHERQPNNVMVLKEICDLMYITHSADEAKKYYQKLYDIKKEDGVLITIKTLCPSFFNSAEEMDKWRVQYEKNLDELLSKDIRIENPLVEIYQSYFKLIYQNRDNKALNIKYAELMRKSCPVINYTAPHITNYKKPEGRKIKIGFILRYDAKHVIAECFFSLFKKLIDNSDYELVIFSTSQIEPKDELWLKYKNLGRGIQLPFDIKKSQEIVASQQLDIIIHPELGINMLAYFLAFARLAPVQCSFAGFPVSSGINTVDYYISSKNFDDETTQDSFSEKVILMENNCDFPDMKEFEGTFKTKEELGLPAGKEIYMVPLKLHKFHPDFDEVIEAILRKDKNGIMILFEDYPYITESLKNRLKNNLNPETFERVIFAPQASSDDFKSYLKAANCLLDGFYFGAGSTGFIAFSLGCPIATVKKGFLRGGRLAAAHYNQIGLQSLIAETKEDYIDLCFRLANDREFYKSAQQKIIENKHLLLNRDEALPELLGVFSDMLNSLQ